MVRLYRGVAVNNLNYQNALLGVTAPVGGTATSEQHNFGDTKSQYTSWTTDLTVAREKASDTSLGGHGLILQKDFSEQELVVSPDYFGESEVLIRGIIVGATVTKVG